jgi:hypothetical protein
MGVSDQEWVAIAMQSLMYVWIFLVAWAFLQTQKDNAEARVQWWFWLLTIFVAGGLLAVAMWLAVEN